MAQQYGGYNQVGYGTNPYEERHDGPGAGRYNNYSQGQYDQCMCHFQRPPPSIISKCH